MAIPACAGASAPAAPLVLEQSIGLGDIDGRIDHLAVDLQRQRLFVAELGNDSVGVLDLKSGTLLRTLDGVHEPQGIVYVAKTDDLYVANGANGAVQVFHGADLSPAATIDLGDDADNLRLSPGADLVVAGYGSGGLALIATGTRRVMARIPLAGHPEGFQLSADGQLAFVNIPEKHQVAVVDIRARKLIATWPTAGLASNFPMALESDGNAVWAGFRNPARLVRFDSATGKPSFSADACGDSDDLFVDRPRHRLYMICGSGHVEIWEPRGASFGLLTRLATASGARTGLFVPELDRLYVASRSGLGRKAAILVYRPDAGSTETVQKPSGNASTH